jgi:hypothetical protein
MNPTHFYSPAGTLQAVSAATPLPVSPYGTDRASAWRYVPPGGGITNTTTAVTIRAAGGTGLRNYITGIQLAADTLTNATEVAIRDGAAGPVLWRRNITTAGLRPVTIKFAIPLVGTANTLLEAVTLTASGSGSVYVNAQGFTAP